VNSIKGKGNILFFLLCDNMTKGQDEFEHRSVKVEDSLKIHCRISKTTHKIRLQLDEPRD
jgi:hypothetical protein